MEEKRGDCVQFDNFAVGKAIRDLRKEKGISQDVLSGFAGIARTHLTMIENGTKQVGNQGIRGNTLVNLFDGFSVMPQCSIP